MLKDEIRKKNQFKFFIKVKNSNKKNNDQVL